MNWFRNVIVLSIVLYSIGQTLSFASDFDLYRAAKYKMWIKITNFKAIGVKKIIADSVYLNYNGKKDSIINLVTWEYQYILLSDSSSVKSNCINITAETDLNAKTNAGDTIFVLLLDDSCHIGRFWPKKQLISKDIRKDIMTSSELKKYTDEKGMLITPKESDIQRVINKMK